MTTSRAVARACASGELRGRVAVRALRHDVRNALVSMTANVEYLGDLGIEPAVLRELEATVHQLVELTRAPPAPALDLEASELHAALSADLAGADVTVGEHFAPALGWLSLRWAGVLGSIRRLRLDGSVLEVHGHELSLEVRTLLADGARSVGAEPTDGPTFVRAILPED